MVFGASGYIGSHIAQAFLREGHEVLGFVRSAAASAKFASLSVVPFVGDLTPNFDYQSAFQNIDCVVFAPRLLLEPEFDVVSAMLNALSGSQKTFVFTSGTAVLAQKTNGLWSEDTFAETDSFTPLKQLAKRVATESLVQSATGRGVRGLVIRPPAVWGNGGSLIIRHFYASAARTGAICYLGAGLNVYSNVHVEDLARLYVLAVQSGEDGHLYHSVSGEVNFRMIAEAVGRQLGLPCRSIGFEEADRLWGRFAAFVTFSTCSRSRSPRARRKLGWKPEHLDMLEDVAHPGYRTLV